MKDFVIVCLTVGVVSTAGSGPYLPSGWKPSGPAFLLPGEEQKAEDNPLKDTLQVEAEGSDFLSEYGPPAQETSQDLTKQDLPDVNIERSFAELKTNEIVQSDSEIKSDEETTEKFVEKSTAIKVNIVEETASTTASVEVITEKVLDESEGKSLVEVSENIEDVTEQLENFATETTVTEQESSKLTEAKEYDNANSDLVAVQERDETVVVDGEEREGKSVDVAVVEEEKEIQGVKNIEEALVNLDNEIKSQQVKNEVEGKNLKEHAAPLGQAPEGFLEYGPPGFREYGPPKELLRSENAEDAVESNVNRRRRFSPKLSLARRAQH